MNPTGQMNYHINTVENQVTEAENSITPQFIASSEVIADNDIIMNIGDLSNYTQSPTTDIGQIPTISSPTTDLGNINQYTIDSTDNLGQINHLTDDPIIDLGQINPYTEDQLINLGELSALTVDPILDLGEINSQTVDPIQDVGVLNLNTIDPFINLGYIENLEYSNSSDKLAISYNVSSSIDNYDHELIFTIPHDAIMVVVTRAIPFVNSEVDLKLLGEYTLAFSSSDDVSITHFTNLGDPNSGIYGGDQLRVITHLPLNGQSGTIQIFAIRNYSYIAPNDQLAFTVDVQSPSNSGLFPVTQRITFQIPEDSIMVCIHGDLVNPTDYNLYTMGGYNLASASATFDTTQFTNIGDPNSGLYPGDWLYFDIGFGLKDTFASFTILSIRNYTYTNSSDQLSLTVQIKSPSNDGLFPATQRFIFQLPQDSSMICIHGDLTSQMDYALYTIEGTNLATASETFDTTLFTSSGDPFSGLSPGDWLYFDISFKNINDIATFKLQTIRNYTYFNSSDQLAINFQCTSPSGQGLFPTTQRIIFQVPHDSIEICVHGELDGVIDIGLYTMTNYELDTGLGTFDMTFYTNIGDPLSAVYPGDWLYLDLKFANKDEQAIVDIFSIRNFTYTNSSDDLGIHYDIKSPIHQGLYPITERFLFTLPLNCLNFVVFGETTPDTSVSVCRSDGYELFMGTNLFNFSMPTLIGNSFSAINPGETLYVNINFENKEDSASITVLSSHNYTYFNGSDELSTQFLINSPATMGSFPVLERVIFTIPVDSTMVCIDGTMDFGVEVKLYLQTGSSISDPPIELRSEGSGNSLIDWIIPTSLIVSSSEIIPGMQIYLDFSFLEQNDFAYIHVYSVRGFNYQTTDDILSMEIDIPVPVPSFTISPTFTSLTTQQRMFFNVPATAISLRLIFPRQRV